MKSVSATARHGRDVKGDGPAVAFLQHALLFRVAQIAANSIGRHLQLCNQFADAQLTGFAKPVENMFCPASLCMAIDSAN